MDTAVPCEQYGRRDAASAAARDLTGKVALVIGGSRDQGAACAESMAARGAVTVLTYSRGEHAAARTLARLDRYAVPVEAIRSDATRSEDVTRLFSGVKTRHGRIDIVVHTVGSMRSKALSDSTDADFDLLIDSNVRSVFHTLRAATAHLADHGRYVVISSALPPAGRGLYAAAKAAVDTLVVAAAHELAARDITVNAVAPGPVGDSAAGEDQPLPASPRGRLGQPEDVARVVEWLTSTGADWVSGQTIRVDGSPHLGLTASRPHTERFQE
ncbi:SDR family oxidoreductase [Nocardia inohanensis]|uniref:SDR family oxidoreductase n=1 Tax=Nocardia inohanensis TaxID=209246 RepID=UPI0009FF941C|nr:SDR family oxidoreductase [Nocardia inohanensis]